MRAKTDLVLLAIDKYDFLSFLRHTDLVAAEPALAAYLARCEARPAFRRALRDQMSAFADLAATG